MSRRDRAPEPSSPWRIPLPPRPDGERLAAAANEVSATYTLSFEGSGEVFLTKPGPLVATMAAAVAAHKNSAA